MPTPNELVLSLFPGADLLERAFQRAGFCVVRGPEKMLDELIDDWDSAASKGRFDGVIAGPPCQNYSDANRRRDTAEGDRLLLECLRVIWQVQPEWFLIENVRRVPDVVLDGYHVQRLDVTDVAFGGRQKRLRHIQFGSRKAEIIRPLRTEIKRSVTQPVVTTKRKSRHSRRARSQGFADLRLGAFNKSARDALIGNGVPLATGSALAQAVRSRSEITVREAFYDVCTSNFPTSPGEKDFEFFRGPVTKWDLRKAIKELRDLGYVEKFSYLIERRHHWKVSANGPWDCICLCGRVTTGRARHATAACRKRMERRRSGGTRSLEFTPTQSRFTRDAARSQRAPRAFTLPARAITTSISESHCQVNHEGELELADV